jgi:AcrR family transcriptional regulator
MTGDGVPSERALKMGRRPGNQDTRGVILKAARQAFAARGFAGASVRAIAADAGVDPSLVHHYFANKQQLFLATVELPLELPQLVTQVAAGGTAGLGERLVRTILRVWDSELQPGLVAAVRTALLDPALARPVREFLSLEVLGRVLSGVHLSPAEAERRSGLIASQIVGLLVGRYLLEFPALTQRSAESLVAEIGPTVQRYLDGGPVSEPL